MPDPLEPAKARLAAVAEEIGALRSDSNELLEERRVLVVKLRAARVKRTEIAELAGCTVDNVKALTRAKKQVRKKKADAPG